MIIVITGKTASGKDTIIKSVLQKYPNLKKIITTTSRKPRENETNGVDYNFISEDEFTNKINKGDFLEHVKYGGNYYGTEKSQISPEKNLIWKIDPSMAGKAKEMFPESVIIYINTNDEVISKRLEKRGIGSEESAERMADDQSFSNQFKDKYDYIIENIPGKLEQTIGKVTQIIEEKGLNQS